MRITLVRHGETSGQSSIRYYGITDVPLSDLGREQMRRAGAALAHERFDSVFSSRLSRSLEGAALVARDALRVRAVPAFDEVNFGRWEGWTRDEIAARDPDDYRAWLDSKDSFRYPGGESRSAFHSRVTMGLGHILTDHTGQHLLMVLHRGVIASILAELLGLSTPERLALAIDLGSIHVVARSEAGWQMECANRIDHLGAA
jgi:broad specificity phosphatase PhoE